MQVTYYDVSEGYNDVINGNLCLKPVFLKQNLVAMKYTFSYHKM